MSDHDETFAAVEEAVLAVPGVADLYRARPTLGSTVTAAKNLATRSTIARVVLDDDVLRIVIGTDGSVPAPETARAAHLAALAAATAHGLPLSRVDVRVARVG
ncbi:hypothetical protein SAMN05660766_1370 [Curtobacterium sp. 314Chir4.1]|jgi:hypothetical protein|uniref:hypothetical protein n=1 Tax=Curtobacterium sp. 314Chir4.1 TaxID=1279028 RepID=UPI000BD969AE|nr:hypothetical protein [Curtobacterium sp. 314Chir4.1]SOC87685.1 hypothetical protein SAMN05660766_1370 [Curtobacterium sp. 314Chir4.1]